MQRLRRGLSILLAAALLLSLAACGTNGGGDASEPSTQADGQPGASSAEKNSPGKENQTLILPFAKRDVLNPYAVETDVNLGLLPLMYEGLFAIDGTFQAQPVLAKSIKKISAAQWAITLQEGRVFHNGNPVTAADVLYSFEKARVSPQYAARLENITKMEEAEKTKEPETPEEPEAPKAAEGAITITLKKANEYIAACLDFPIVPNGSAEEGALLQAVKGYVFTKATTPVGTGRYALKSEDDTFYLAYDERHTGEAPAITTIEFFGLSSTGALMYGLEMENYHFAYDDLSGGMTDRVSAASARVNTTNLLYLTFNRGRAGLSDAKLRAALAACIDKAKALSESFAGYAQPANTPFPPQWYGVKTADFAKPYDLAEARKALEALGYTETREGVRASRYRKLSFTLLVNKDSKERAALARAIASQFAAVQVGVVVQELPKNDYISAARAGRFDLCLGEIRLTPDCDLSPLLLTGGAASAGIDVWGRAPSAYGQMLQGLQKPAEFASVFREEQPFVPIGYRSGMAVNVRKLRIPGPLMQNNLFQNIEEWSF